MSANTNTNTKVPNPSNPSSLHPRFEIRKLEPKHEEWATAIITHSNIIHSPVWPVLYPENLTDRIHKTQAAASYLIAHQVNSGLSFGVFDTQYKYKREESKATGGKLYWDENEKGIQEEKGKKAEGERLLEQMDFPLVSVAMSYDSMDPLDQEKMGPLIGCLPAFGTFYHILHEGDKRKPESWQATARGQVLFRNATATRADYEGQKHCAGLARWLMREADALGFRGIQVECQHDAVTYVWSNPPAPYKATVVSEFHTETWRNEKGELEFYPAKQRVTKIYTELKPTVEAEVEN